MGLTTSQRRAVTQTIATRYRRASKAEKGKILDGPAPATTPARHSVARRPRIVAPRPAGHRVPCGRGGGCRPVEDLALLGLARAPVPRRDGLGHCPALARRQSHVRGLPAVGALGRYTRSSAPASQRSAHADAGTLELYIDLLRWARPQLVALFPLGT